MFCYVELHSSRKSIGHSLNVLPLYCKKKFFVFSSLGKKKRSFDIFKHWLQLSGLSHIVAAIHGWFKRGWSYAIDDVSTGWMSLDFQVSPEAFTAPGFSLCRTKQGCPGLNHYLCYSFPLKWQLCYFFAVPSCQKKWFVGSVTLREIGARRTLSRPRLLGTAGRRTRATRMTKSFIPKWV